MVGLHLRKIKMMTAFSTESALAFIGSQFLRLSKCTIGQILLPFCEDIWINTCLLCHIIIQNETGKSAGETVSIDELNDVTYSATSDGNVITGIEYGGVFKITVPSSLTGSGEEESYEMEMDLDIDFVNPGEAVTVELPDSADFEELK
jgi:hypothetical protein